MCSPELTRGLCQICTGSLTPENTFVDDDGNAWDEHKGVCAIHAGAIDPVPYYHRPTYVRYLARIQRAKTQWTRQEIIKAFYKWVNSVAEEDHRGDDGAICTILTTPVEAGMEDDMIKYAEDRDE